MYFSEDQVSVSFKRLASRKRTDGKKTKTHLDPFAGSGTLGIACEKSGRRALLMELDPKYCDVIIKRWQDFTGKKATHAETGKQFDELKNVQKAA